MNNLLLGAGAFAAGLLVKKLLDVATGPKTLAELDAASDQLYLDAGYTFATDGSLVDSTGKAVAGLGGLPSIAIKQIAIPLDPDDPSIPKPASMPSNKSVILPPTVPGGLVTKITPPATPAKITPPTIKRGNDMRDFMQSLMYPRHPKYNAMFNALLQNAKRDGIKVTAVAPYGYPLPKWD